MNENKNISPHTIEELAILIMGEGSYRDDAGGNVRYRTGKDLQDFFRCNSSIGFMDFSSPSRKQCTVHALCLIAKEGTNELKSLIEATINSNNATTEEKVKRVKIFNKTLKNDGLELKINSKSYWELSGYSEILVKDLEIKEISDTYIGGKIKAAEERIRGRDYGGAITMARTLLEEVLLYAIDKHDDPGRFNGDLTKIYKEVKKYYRFSEYEQIGGGLGEMLRGLNSIVNGIAHLRNEASDSHHTNYKPDARIAQFAVNASLTICYFMIKTYENKK